MTKPELIEKARMLLQKQFSRLVPRRGEAAAHLADYPPFDDMDDEDLLPIVEKAIAAMGGPSLAPAASPAARPGGFGGHRPGGFGGGGGSGSNARKSRDPIGDDLLTAPYRFVSIVDHVVPAPEPVTEACHDFPLPGGFSGVLTVTWAFETPMSIGAEADGVSEPFRLGDRFAIPGASLRGMLRAATAIVTRARLAQINDNHRYGVRDFTHPLFAEGDGDGAKRLQWSRLGAGWLRRSEASAEERREGLSDYVLTPCDKKLIRIRALPASFNGNRATSNGSWHASWLQTKLAERYRLAGYVTGASGRDPLFDFESTQPTSFVVDPLAPQSDPARGDYVVPGDSKTKGWFVVSANSPSHRNIAAATLDAEDNAKNQKGLQKKRECVFFDRPGETPIRLPQSVIDSFIRINSRPGRTNPVPEGSYKVLEPTLRAGRRIPVFFAGDPKADVHKVDLGLTRLFKLPHKYSVGDVRDRQPAHKPKPGAPDMVEALFGYVHDRLDYDILEETSVRPDLVARKGRVAFGFAMLDRETPADVSGTIATVAAAPRASYAPFYLAGPIKDWTDQDERGRTGGARLAGRKRYFPRFPRGELAGAASAITVTLDDRRYDANRKELSRDLQSRLKLLTPRQRGGELRFTGEILLHNVLAEEIGALLWTLTHGGDPAKPYRHMIGRAKNAGAGQARVASLSLRLEAHPGAGSRANLLVAPGAWELPGEGREGWLTPESSSMAPFLREFERYMRTHGGEPNWPEAAIDIQEFLGLSHPAKGRHMKAGFIPSPNDHGKLRRSVKADVSKKDPADSRSRLLDAPRQELKPAALPYREAG